MTNIDFPFHVDERRRTAMTGLADHVRDLVEQLVLTAPGERVMRPTFGAGLQQLVFAPNSTELAAALQFLINGALQQYLADPIEVGAVEVDAVDAQLVVQISYVLKETGQQITTQLEVSR
jgi:phage baseplate assembly protein W